jgi:hypothetical protein
MCLLPEHILINNRYDILTYANNWSKNSSIVENLKEISLSKNSVVYPDDAKNLKAFGDSEIESYEDRVAAIQAMRDIYEATLAAHIELVGTPDEYSGFANIDPYADSYRKDRLHGEQYSSAYEAWQIVKDKTLQDFRDGNLQVYVPVHENTDLVNRSSRGFSPDATCLGGAPVTDLNNCIDKSAHCRFPLERGYEISVCPGIGIRAINNIECGEFNRAIPNTGPDAGSVLILKTCTDHGGEFVAVTYKDC